MPIMIYNPHPYEIISDFEVEFQMAEQNHPGNGIYDIDIADENGKTVSCQLEQEDSAHGMDWRKKLFFTINRLYRTQSKNMMMHGADTMSYLKLMTVQRYTPTDITVTG